MKKGGQLTIFMILGMVLLLIFGMVLYVQQLSQESFVESTTQNEVLQTSSVAFNTFIKECIGSRLESRLNYILKQGGHSEFDLPLSYGTPSDFVSYAITNDVATVLEIPKDFSGISLFDTLDSSPSQPYFGKNTLPKLCDKYGQNTINSSNAFTCLSGLYGESDTVQNQLEDALAIDIQSCFANDVLQSRYDFTRKGTGNVSIGFTEDSIIVLVDNSIDFNSNLQSIPEISYTYPLRVKKLYSAAYLLIEEDISNVKYDKKSDYASICSGCFEGILVNVIEDYAGVGNDLVILKDTLSSLSINDPVAPNFFPYTDSEYLAMAFLVENRRPYLDYIADISASGRDYTSPPITDQRRDIFIPVVVYDPDEDSVSSDTVVLNVNDGNSAAIEDLPYNTNVWLGCFSDSACEYLGPNPSVPSNYNSVTYSVQITSSDGLESDYQTFDITINP